MDKIKQKIILTTLHETGIFDSQSSGNKLLNYAIKKRKKLRLQKMILSICNKTPDRKLNEKVVIVPKTKKSNFLSKIQQFSNDEFKRNFMMRRTTFMCIAKCLERNWRAKTGLPANSIEIPLYLTIWKLTKNCTFEEISNLFNIPKGGSIAYFLKVIHLLYTNRKKFIKWPKDNESKLEIIEKFHSLIKNPIPNTIGCVDAMDIRIVEPKENKHNYINEDGIYSLILQGICDSEKKFIDVFFGQPGSYSKSTVWESSPINDALKTHYKIEDEYILGNFEYPLKPYLIVPYCNNEKLTVKQKCFNNKHEYTRFCVEESFKILKSRFSILENIDVNDMDNIKYTVIACVVLHNIIIEKEGTNETIDEENDIDVNKNSELNKAKIIRDKLAMRCVP